MWILTITTGVDDRARTDVVAEHRTRSAARAQLDEIEQRARALDTTPPLRFADAVCTSGAVFSVSKR